MKQYKQLLCGWLLAIGLSACEAAVEAETVLLLAPPQQMTCGSDEEETVTMASIKVAPGYDFTTSQQLEVDVDLRAITDQRAFVGFLPAVER